MGPVHWAQTATVHSQEGMNEVTEVHGSHCKVGRKVGEIPSPPRLWLRRDFGQVREAEL